MRRILKVGEIPMDPEDCDPGDPSTADIAQDLWDTMRATGVASISAPQIGQPVRMILVDSEDGPLFILNPVITAREGQEDSEETCASLPGGAAGPGGIIRVKRARRIYLRGMSLEGRSIGTEVAGREASLIQHEVDHLDGQALSWAG